MNTGGSSPPPPNTVIFGCGNILLGDDGFGPAVIEALQKQGDLPENVEALDIGTSIRDHLFDYLLAEEMRPHQIIIIDSIDTADRSPGEVFLIDHQKIPTKKQHDYSLHQFPTVNMLQELSRFTDIAITIIVAQIAEPAEEVCQQLSEPIQQAIPLACDLVLSHISKPTR